MRSALPYPPRKVSFRRSSAPLAAALAAAPLALSACLTLGTGAPPADDGSEEENAEPTYQVHADQTESSCGVGTVTLQESWSFSATLVVDDDGESVTFNTGGGDHEGELDEDGSFEVVAEIEVNMRTADS